MIFKLYIALCGLFGLFQLFRIKGRFAWVITAFLVLGVLLAFIPNNFIRLVGVAFLNFPVFLVIVYAVSMKGFSVGKRVSLLLQAIPFGLVQVLSFIERNPITPLGYIMIIPISALFYSLAKVKDFREEIGFLLIMSSYVVARLALTIQHSI